MKENTNEMKMDKENPLGRDLFIVSGYEIFQLHAYDLVMEDGTRLIDTISPEKIGETDNILELFQLTHNFVGNLFKSKYKCEYWNINDKEGTIVSDYVISDEDLDRLEKSGLIFEDIKDAKVYVEERMSANGDKSACGEKQKDGYSKCDRCIAKTFCPKSTSSDANTTVTPESIRSFINALKEFAATHEIGVTAVDPRRYTIEDGKLIDLQTGEAYGIGSNNLEDFMKGIREAAGSDKISKVKSPNMVLHENEKLGHTVKPEMKVTLLKDRNAYKQGGFFVYVDDEGRTSSLYEKDTRWVYVEEIHYFNDSFCLVDMIYNTNGTIIGKRVKMGSGDVQYYFPVSERTYVSFPRHTNGMETPEHYNGIKMVSTLHKFREHMFSDLSEVKLSDICNEKYDFYTVYKKDNRTYLSYVTIDTFDERYLRQGYIRYEETIIHHTEKEKVVKQETSGVDTVESIFSDKLAERYASYEEALDEYNDYVEEETRSWKKHYDMYTMVYLTNLEDLSKAASMYTGFAYRSYDDILEYVDCVYVAGANGSYFDFIDFHTGLKIKPESLLNKELIVFKEGPFKNKAGEFKRESFYMCNNIKCISKVHDIYKVTGEYGPKILLTAFEEFKAEIYDPNRHEMNDFILEDDEFYIDDISYEWNEEELLEIIQGKEIRIVECTPRLESYFDDVDSFKFN